MSSPSRGKWRESCHWHVSGLDIDVKRDSFFKAGCTMCELKKERGIVTGNEPPPKYEFGNRMRKNRAMLSAKRIGKTPGFVPFDAFDHPAYAGAVREILFDGRAHAALVD